MKIRTEPETRQEMLKILVKERLQWEALLGTLTQDQYLQPGIDGHLSVKDLMAHITAWEQRMIQWISESYADIVPQRPAPGITWEDLDKLNQQTYLENRDRELEEIIADSTASYSQSLEVIQSMTDADLFDGSRFAWREGDPIWHMVAANTWWHYREHRQQVEAWLKSTL